MLEHLIYDFLLGLSWFLAVCSVGGMIWLGVKVPKVFLVCGVGFVGLCAMLTVVGEVLSYYV